MTPSLVASLSVALLRASGAFALGAVEDVSSADQAWSACEACEWGVRSVQDFVADVSHQRTAEEALDAVLCADEAAASRGECERGVAAAVRQVVRAFEDYVSPQALCRPVCPRAAAAPAPPRVTDWQCPFCEYLVVEAARLLQNKTADAEVLAFVEQQCAALPAAFQEQCRTYVDTDGQQLIDLLESTPPAKVCAEAGACAAPHSLAAALRAAEPSAALRADVAELLARVGRVRLAATCAAPRGVPLGDPPSEECQFCRVAVTEARAKLADPEFQHEVEVFLEKFCTRTGDYEEMCKDYIQEYGPLAFAMALDYLRPTLVCVDLVHLCPKPPPAAAVA